MNKVAHVVDIYEAALEKLSADLGDEMLRHLAEQHPGYGRVAVDRLSAPPGTPHATTGPALIPKLENPMSTVVHEAQPSMWSHLKNPKVLAGLGLGAAGLAAGGYGLKKYLDGQKEQGAQQPSPMGPAVGTAPLTLG